MTSTHLDHAPKERALREQKAWDETPLYENIQKLHHRFSHVYSCPAVQRADQWRLKKLRQAVHNGVVLDYGCYMGSETSVYLEMNPKELWGIDISMRGIEYCRRTYGNRAMFVQGDAQQMTMFRDGYFDVIVGWAILHHLHFPKAIHEIRRVLKPGGTAIFMEPLRDNPAGKLFRLLTPQARTKDEMPLSRRQIEWADSMFSGSDHYFLSLTSTPVAVATSLIPGLSSNNALLSWCADLDDRLRYHPVKYWMRAVYLCWIK